MSIRSMIILGIDPGNARCGWGVVEKSGGAIGYVDCGCIETSKDSSEADRLAMVGKGIRNVISHFGPDEAAAESIFLFKNPKTVIQVAEGRGAALAALATCGVPVFSYTPLQIKQALTSYGRAEKGQVQRMVVRLLQLTAVPKPDDAVDALAVALCHAAVPEAMKKACA